MVGRNIAYLQASQVSITPIHLFPAFRFESATRTFFQARFGQGKNKAVPSALRERRRVILGLLGRCQSGVVSLNVRTGIGLGKEQIFFFPFPLGKFGFDGEVSWVRAVKEVDPRGPTNAEEANEHT